jgi:hypothetical protein
VSPLHDQTVRGEGYQRPKFSLSPLTVVLILIVAGLSALHEYQPNASSAYQSGRLMGVVFAAILFPVFFAWIAHLISRSGRRAANITACVIACLVLLGRVSTNAAEQRDQQVWKKVAQTVAELKEDSIKKMRRAAEAGLEPPAQDVMLRRLALRLRQVATTSADPTRSVLNAMAEQDMDLSRHITAYDTAADAYWDAGHANPRTLGSAQQVEERIGLLDHYVKMNQRVIAKMRSFPSDLVTCMRNAGMPKQHLEQFVREKKSAQHSNEAAIQTRVIENRLLSIDRQVLVIYKQTFGQWRIDENGTVVFDNASEALIDEYNRLRREAIAAHHQYEESFNKALKLKTR